MWNAYRFYYFRLVCFFNIIKRKKNWVTVETLVPFLVSPCVPLGDIVTIRSHPGQTEENEFKQNPRVCSVAQGSHQNQGKPPLSSPMLQHKEFSFFPRRL